MNNLDPQDGPHYFRVAATNDAGESIPSEVLAATPGAAPSRILIVNGYDRIDRHLNISQIVEGGSVDRVRQAAMNSRNYVVQVMESIEAHDAALGVDAASNEAVVAGDVGLATYEAVVWILGLESTADQTLDATEQTLLTTYVENGGNLFLSGAEVGFDLDLQGNGSLFYDTVLHSDCVADDANTNSVQGVVGSVFEGLAFDFDDDANEVYVVRYPDVVAATGSAVVALDYIGGSGGGAAIQYESVGSEGDVVYLGFPFESILGAQNRELVMSAVLDFLLDPATAVAELPPELPDVGRLGLTAHPNPFNPTTTINYELPRESRVRIEIFTVGGRQVRTLRDRREPAGPGAARWNGDDDAGASVSSGTYLCRIRAAGLAESVRLTVVR